MSEEKRFVLFLVLTMLVVVCTPIMFQWVFGPPPRPAAKVPDVANPDAEPNKDADEPPPPNQVADKVEPAAAPAGDKPVAKVAEAPPEPENEPNLESRTLGSTDPASGFKIKVQFTNLGAAVRKIELANFQGEERKGPLELVSSGEDEAGSFLLGLKGLPTQLEDRRWKILEAAPNPDESRDEESLRFQTTLPEQNLQITKTFRLQKDSFNLLMEIELSNTGDAPFPVSYRLSGPRGFVLEGAWYATKKREVAFADGIGSDLKRQPIATAELVKGADRIRESVDDSGAIRREKWTMLPEWFDRFDLDHNGKLMGPEIDAAAYHLAGPARDKKYRWVERPVRFAGVEGQFFCVLLVVPPHRTVDDRWDAATVPVLVQRDRRFPDRSDSSVEIESKSFTLIPGEVLRHSYSIYSGPKQRSILDTSLNDSAIVQSIMNFQGALFIFPTWLVSFTAGTMLYLLQIFHGWVGNWGIAIIMLTVLVRLLMFPLSRKQALSAVKMQSLKPELDELREKHKNDKEKLSKAQMELWRKHGVNPLGGCLPLVVQMPIFIGLWQGLQSSVDLRQAKFLWIQDLAAPDGPSVPFFEWGENIPLVSWMLGPYFNLLPCLLIALMMIQQKMFMPPKADPPDPQMEMQQKMMTYMLFFFGCFFWRLPSGLCVYYIASTLWGIAERKLLPKLQHAEPVAVQSKKGAESSDGKERSNSDRDGKGPGRDGKGKRPPRSDKPSLTERLNELIKRASKR